MTGGRTGGNLMDWYNVKGTVRPEETDTTSSKKYNYIRKDIEEITEEVEGETMTVYTWLECKILKEDWVLFGWRQQDRADIDYMLMITEDL